MKFGNSLNMDKGGSQTIRPRQIRLWRFGLLICGWGLGFWGWGFRILGLGRVLGANCHGFDKGHRSDTLQLILIPESETFLQM